MQAAAIAYAVFGLFKFIDNGAVVDKATQESGETFDGVVGFIVHGFNGYLIVPALALILLVVAFFAKVPGGVKWAAILFGLVVLQFMLGGFAHEVPAVGAVHGLNALAVFTVALIAARRARAVPVAKSASSDAKPGTDAAAADRRTSVGLEQ